MLTWQMSRKMAKSNTIGHNIRQSNPGTKNWEKKRLQGKKLPGTNTLWERDRLRDRQMLEQLRKLQISWLILVFDLNSS